MKKILNTVFKRKIKLKKSNYDMTYTDVLALILACFEVFLPVFIIVGAVIFGMIVLLLNIWIK